MYFSKHFSVECLGDSASTCYCLFTNALVSRDDALATCESYGAQLGQITSPAEDEFLASAVLSDSSGIGTDYWIGMSLHNKTFSWMDGSPISYTFWDDAVLEIEDAATDCILILPASSGDALDSVDCNATSLFICEGSGTGKYTFKIVCAHPVK